ncbi:MAG: L-threonylcarbamoyladenylate synthase [Acidimicrobiales bacterium]|jgi:tRNA threonylcarbamoyl adenosine modification protein (Sua5/YciO/YrdC/YwlC family)
MGAAGEPDGFEEALVALRAGQVVALPTDTVYGLAVDPRLEGATAELFRLKGRPETFALPVLLGDGADAWQLGVPDRRAVALAARYWPGALTIVVFRQPAVGFDLGGDPVTIGLRCPADATARRLLSASGPLAVTSANAHGAAPCRSAEEVRRVFGAGVHVLDGGPSVGQPSTVVSFVGDGVACLRQGSIPMGEIDEVLASLSPGEG